MNSLRTRTKLLAVGNFFAIMLTVAPQMLLADRDTSRVCYSPSLQISRPLQAQLNQITFPERSQHPQTELECRKGSRQAVPLQTLNSHLPQPARDSFDLAFLKPTDKVPVREACTDMVQQGRDSGTYAGRGGPNYFSCRGNQIVTHPAAPCQTAEDRVQIRKIFHLVADCLNLDPQMIFPLWTEESGFQTNIRNRNNDVGIAQMNRISLKDSAQTLASERNRQLILGKLGAKLEDPICKPLLQNSAKIAQKILSSMRSEEAATGANLAKFSDARLCEQTGAIVTGEDSAVQNMIFSAVTFAKSVYYFNHNMKRIFKSQPDLANLPFASNEDARKIFSVLARETGFGHVHATRLATQVLKHYNTQLHSPEFVRNNPKGVTFQRFYSDFLEGKTSKFNVHKLIQSAANVRTKNSTYSDDERLACFAEFRPTFATPVKLAQTPDSRQPSGIRGAISN